MSALPYYRILMVMSNGKVVTRKSRAPGYTDRVMTELHAAPYWQETRVTYAQAHGPSGIVARAMFPLNLRNARAA